MKKNMFLAIAIALTLTSCRKDVVFGQSPYGNDVTVLAAPQIVSISADASTATVFYNGRQVTLKTVSAKNLNGTGITMEPPTRPAQWNPSNQGYIADGMVFNNGMSADMALVYYVYITYLSATTIAPPEVRSMQMYWTTAPTHTSDRYAYIDGTYNLKTGWVGGPYSFVVAGDGSVWIK